MGLGRAAIALVVLVASPSVALAASSADPVMASLTPLSPASASGCGDTVSALLCDVFDLLNGPRGVVPFATGEAAWLISTAQQAAPGGV